MSLICIISERGYIVKKVIRSNDEIERIYHEYNNMIYRICFAYMKNVSEAEDMVSDTFV